MNKNFTCLGLSEATLTALSRLNYQNPTPVQEKAIPAALEGKDIAVAAQTGTGKTAAFALPLVDRIASRKGKKPSALVITPTRELALQIESVMLNLAQSSGHRVAVLVGGMPYGKQLNRLRKGVDILIATPGRLNDMIDRNAVSLDRVEMLVLDEADRMLDMGFLPAMKSIIGKTPSSRQTLLFSATIDRKVLGATKDLLHDPTFIEIAHKGETADTIKQYIVPIPQNRKQDLLKAILEKRGAKHVIVFARTKSRSDLCAAQLRRAGYQAEAIHSDRTQRERKRALDSFRKGSISILVATDVLARGIDVIDVEHVINYDLPDNADDYIHRIGRTGRAGREGDAVSFVSFDAKGELRDIERLVGEQIPFLEVEGFEYAHDAAALRKKNPPFKSPRFAQKRGRYRASKKK